MPFEYDFSGLWHKWLMESSLRMAKAGHSMYYISPNMWGNHSGDTLLTLLGSEQLMYDCADDPEGVSRALEKITDAQYTVFRSILNMVKESGMVGGRCATGVWSPKSCLSFDCDVSAMISRELYDHIFLPPMLRMLDLVDHRIYHLDGPEALHHLPTILSIPQIQAVQWVCGVANENLQKWYELYDKIQASKKSIIVYAKYDEVLDVCKRLKPEGLAISFESPSEDKMNEMVEKVSKMYGAQ